MALVDMYHQNPVSHRLAGCTRQMRSNTWAECLLSGTIQDIAHYRMSDGRRAVLTALYPTMRMATVLPMVS